MSAEYIIAWAIYVVAGIGCSVVWWRITGFVGNRGWRDLLRGIAIVLIFTPWFLGEQPEFFAPAIVVLLMDVLLEGTESGLRGGIALVFATFAMVCVLAARVFLVRRSEKAVETPDY